MSNETLLLHAEGIFSELVGEFRLHPMSFDIYRGECVALFGPSGCGKSLLLALIAGEIGLEAGVLECADFARMPDLPTGRAAFNLTPNKWMKRYASSWSRAVYLLELLGLSECVDAPIGELSAGERAMLQVGGALAQQAWLYLLDDPFDKADFERARRLWMELEDRCRFGAAVLFATRDPAVARHADRVLMLHHGCLIAFDAPDNLLRELQATRLEIETTDPQPLLDTIGEVELRIVEQGDGYRLSLFADDALALRLLQEGYGNVRAVYLREPNLADAWQYFALRRRYKANLPMQGID
ncbi:MAG: ATP-binding cassette domain-containing protein [Fimbriimonadales bacterium]|nr:ATP-binding cassette domain-containing protein [Fimbriimonadales bacterium]